MSEFEEQREAIRKLFLEYGDSLYRYARYSLPSDIDARDVVQEVFLRAFKSWAEFRGQASPKTWLFRIARNYIYDLLRQRKRHRSLEIQIHLSPGSVELDTLIELEDALGRLRQDFQQVLNLRWIQDMTVSETAEILGWSETKVRVTFHRAKRRLQGILRDDPVIGAESSQTGGAAINGKEG